jgi:antitoxin YefM
MKTTTLTDFRKNIKSKMDQVYDDHDVLIISRKAEKDMVLMSLRDYESLNETAYLLGNPANAARLMRSLENAKAGKTKAKSSDELGLS